MLRALSCVLLAASAVVQTEPTSVQRCNTQCQDTFTECVLACDGDVPCERRCQLEVTRCVEVCRKPAAPAR